ncbi:MAG TPA: rod shape-determining protein MreC [Anaerolineae bacterium]|nr:rod shape-determining protein MreC [Anaerolineae bacterium]
MKRLQNRPLLLVLLLTTIVALALHETGNMQAVENLILRPVTPIQDHLSSLANDFGDLVQTFRDLRELRRRNEELQSLADSLTIENVRLKELESENETLRQLLQFTQANPTYSYRAAEVVGRVIGRDPSNLLRYIIIDVGTSDGVTKGMPVVTDRGLVGRIVEVSSKSSKVLLITDVSSSVNAIIQSSRATGIVEGKVDGGLMMKYIPQPVTVNVGDIILTSGLGATFPKRLVIGQVTAVHKRDIEMFQQAEIKPTVDFDRLEIVLVITNFEPIEMAQ